MPTESEAASYATTSSTDFYTLLALPSDLPFTPAQLRKAFRRTSLIYHPDKNPSPEAAEAFHLLTIAYDILSDPTSKAAYDNARAARLAKKRRSDAFDLERRRMQEDLETREAGAKRQKTEEDEFLAQFERLRQEGAALRKKREEALKKAEEEEKRELEEAAKNKKPESMFSELDRTLKVKWRSIEEVDDALLSERFGVFGGIEETVIAPGKERKRYRSALVVFADIVGAHAAMSEAKGKAELKIFKSVLWAAGEPPDLSSFQMDASASTSKGEGSNTPTPQPPSHPRSPFEFPTTPLSKFKEESSGKPKRVPSFGSFKSTPGGKNPPFSKSGVAQSPDYENITLMRMREAEKRKIEAEIRRKEEEEAKSGTDEVNGTST